MPDLTDKQYAKIIDGLMDALTPIIKEDISLKMPHAVARHHNEYHEREKLRRTVSEKFNPEPPARVCRCGCALTTIYTDVPDYGGVRLRAIKIGWCMSCTDIKGFILEP